MPERTGVSNAVAEAMSGSEPDRSDLGGQGWLLDEPPVAPRKPGRPAGSYNRSSSDLRNYLQALDADPTVALVRFYDQALGDPRKLAEKLGCEPLDVAKLGVQAAAAVQPYVRSKAPVEHHVKGDGLTIVLGDVALKDPDAGLAGGVSGIGPVLDLAPMESE